MGEAREPIALQPHCEPHALPQGSCTSQPCLSSHQVSCDGFALLEFINLSEQQTPLQLCLCQVKPHYQGCGIDKILFISPNPSPVEMKTLAEVYFHHFLGLASVTPLF